MKEIYLNPMQREIIWIGAKITVWVGGRGVGKGPTFAAIILRNVKAMPGSTGAYVCPDALKAKTNTIPSMTWFWEALGYKENVHWVIGKQPPKKLGWKEPLYKPQSYENMISWYNGAVIQIVAQSRSATSNSKSFDYVIVDEAKFIDFRQLKEETFQANRGQIKEFGECPWHHSITIASDMPTDSRGSWFLRYEQKATPELIEMIAALNIEISKLEKEIEEEGSAAPEWKVKKKQRLEKMRRTCRSKAVFFKVYSSLTNLEVLGEQFIADQRRDLPDSTFYSSILCKRPGTNQMGFYVSMRLRNIYRAKVNKNCDLNDSRRDTDLVDKLPICIGMDFNKLINCLVVGQAVESQGRLNTLKGFHVKYRRRLRELVNDVCDYYKYWRKKEVVFYYDHTAKQGGKAINDVEYKDVVISGFKARGWMVHPIYIGRTERHEDRHLLITEAFQGKQRLEPFFNEVNCADLLVAMDNAGVWNNEKDKRREKLPETDDDPLEHRTDYTDAWDTLLVGCIKYPYRARAYRATSNWSR